MFPLSVTFTTANEEISLYSLQYCLTFTCVVQDSDADIKKTDAFVEDDQHISEGEAEAEGEAEPEEVPERPSKADLEGPEVEPDSTEVSA